MKIKCLSINCQGLRSSAKLSGFKCLVGYRKTQNQASLDQILKKSRERRYKRFALRKELNRLISTNSSNENKLAIEERKTVLTDLDCAAIAGAKIRSKELFTQN